MKHTESTPSPAPARRRPKRYLAKSDKAIYEIRVSALGDGAGFEVRYQNLITNKTTRLGNPGETIPTMQDVMRKCIEAIRAEDSSVFGLLPFPEDEDRAES